MSFEAGTVDLVTCCAAVHWFDFDTFYKEVDRVLRPGGVLACYSYMLCTPVCRGHSLRSTVEELFHELQSYWTESHSLLWEEYSTLPQLYSDDLHIGSSGGGFRSGSEGTVEEVVGYMESWSAVNKLKEKEGKEAALLFLKEAKQRLLQAAGTDNDKETFTRQYDYFLRMWRKPFN
ncbi:putative methyltransferase [Chionoecetes opilio]|uniref:Putative methyltransferase n=1 Tax=Chionoecetes opilio TaxID=41210 RepID=A0A8J8WKW9_CHIOP|nr:putative methyltransferase [Chionoecetes opilio]